MPNHTEAKNRSYSFRPERGDTVYLTEGESFCIIESDPVWKIVDRREFPAGTAVQVSSVSNAGFRGIEAHVRVPGTDFSGTVSTGLLTDR